MREILLSTLLTLTIGSTPCQSAIFAIELSPANGALNLGSTTYTRDHVVGIGAANEEDQPASAATGNEVGTGITYDGVTNILNFDIAYGSAFGFVDLSSEYDDVHFHAPGPVNYPATNSSGMVIHNLDGFHTASSEFSGRITGSVLFTNQDEIDLFDNLVYINIHTRSHRGGEIRGQLIPVPEPSAGTMSLFLTGVLLALRKLRM